MDSAIDKELATHVLQSHVFRKTGESDGEALRIETSADVVIMEKPRVRFACKNTISIFIIIIEER